VQATNIDLAAVGDTLQFSMTIGSVQTTIINISDARVVVLMELEVGGTGTPQSLIATQFPWRHNFTTTDGFGYLMAADTFRISGNSNGMGAAVTYAWKLFYRFVEVPISEFIGIVQSTQQS